MSILQSVHFNLSQIHTQEGIRRKGAGRADYMSQL